MDRKPEVPPPFLQAIDEAFATRSFDLSDARVEMVLANTIAMEPKALMVRTRLESMLRIVLDWALIERALMFCEHCRQQVGTPGAAKSIVEYLRCECLLIAARQLAAEFDPIWAENCLDAFMACDSGNPGLDAARHGEVAKAYSLYIAYHELAHEISKRSPDAVAEHFRQFAQTYPRLVVYETNKRHAEELFCDAFALRQVWPDNGPEPEIVSAIVLLTIYMELYTIVKNMVWRGEGRTSRAVEKEMADHQLLDRIYRGHQIEWHLAEIGRTGSDARLRAVAGRWAGLQRALLQAVDEALCEGITQMGLLQLARQLPASPNAEEIGRFVKERLAAEAMDEIDREDRRRSTIARLAAM